jgi:hypothetical protein
MRKTCALLALLAACASPAVMPRERFEMLKEVEEDDPSVGRCKKVGRFVGNSALPGTAGLQQAREAARYKAAGAGATHVATSDETQTPDFTGAAVKAWDCNSPRP